MFLDQSFLKWILLGTGAMAIVFPANSAQASPPLSLEPEFTRFEAVNFEPVIDLDVDLEAIKTSEIPADLVEILAETLTADLGSLTSIQTLPWSFTESPSQEDRSETWVATAESLMVLDQGMTVEEAVLPSLRPAPALAQVRPANQGDGWEFVLEPYIFVPLNVTTDVTVGGITQSVSTGLGDILNLDRAFSGALRFEARQPQYGFFADVSYTFVRDGRGISDFPLPPALAGLASLRTGQNIPPGTPSSVDVTATGRTTTVNLGGYYRVVDRFLGATETNTPTYPRLLVDPALGLRLVALSGSLDFDVALGPIGLEDLNLSNSAVLVKPLLGVKASLEPSDRWGLGLQGDISGPALGSGDSFAWSIVAGGRYRFTNTLALLVRQV